MPQATHVSNFDSQYTTLSRIGAGGCGTVYLVEEKETKRQFAMKTVECRSDEQLNHALDEFSIVRGLTHPGIVQYHKIFVRKHQDSLGPQDKEQRDACLLMDFMPEGDLDKFMDAKGQLPSDTIAMFGEQVADALQYLHSNGIMHRDVKPQNMLMTSKGTQIKLSDFGLVRGTCGTRRTIAGTFFYMAPEQARGNYNEKADMFSVGMVLAELMAPDYVRNMSHPQLECVDDEDGFRSGMREAMEANGHPQQLVSITLELLYKAPDFRLSAAQLVQRFKDLRRSLSAGSNGLSKRNVQSASPLPMADSREFDTLNQPSFPSTVQAPQFSKTQGRLAPPLGDASATFGSLPGQTFEPGKRSIEYACANILQEPFHVLQEQRNRRYSDGSGSNGLSSTDSMSSQDRILYERERERREQLEREIQQRDQRERERVAREEKERQDRLHREELEREKWELERRLRLEREDEERRRRREEEDRRDTETRRNSVTAPATRSVQSPFIPVPATHPHRAMSQPVPTVTPARATLTRPYTYGAPTYPNYSSAPVGGGSGPIYVDSAGNISGLGGGVGSMGSSMYSGFGSSYGGSYGGYGGGNNDPIYVGGDSIGGLGGGYGGSGAIVLGGGDDSPIYV